ncbi:hypothetical protein OEZ86_004893 [Tetradesmus obliquus]|nr:hypothetical protein OEZ86_004893 [Tetradesmus obliquus]
MADVRPFRVSVPESELKYLRQRLDTARYPDILTNIAPWEDGTDLDYFKTFIDYWRLSYDWRKWEAVLNSSAQFTATIRGIQLHFVWEQSERKDAIPLLLLHGWPGSYFEFHKLIPMLKATGRYHIVAPSLPGYGWSSAASERGMGVTAIAGIMDSLMSQLGYRRYLAQGGDWGAIICRALGVYHSGSCAGIHINMCVAPPKLTNPWHLAQVANAWLAPRLPLTMSEAELQGVTAMQHFMRDETGYQKIQGTKPQTLAYALTDSPVGLAAWILEKVRTWSDCGGVPDNALSKDEVLTNICVYWFSGRIASSMRLYKESLRNKLEMQKLLGPYCSTPTGVAIFPGELHRPPQSWAKSVYNIQLWSQMPQGGHFAAWEQPALLAGEIAKFADLAEAKGWLA